ncbi:MAG TPA: AIR synthase-related protein, partial [Microlunatus sp.]|nr:AIR synthase-related protein [Microlunatus sp.]
ETAEHPGLLGPDEYDVAGAATGVVERDALLGAERVVAGDVALAIASSGLHSNGYSLVRHVFGRQAGWSYDRHVPEFGRTLGEELLVPTRIYSRDILALIDAVEVHAISHITGGGLANNLARVVPDAVEIRIDRGTWRPAPIFDVVRQVGSISLPDLEATLNMGVGMVVLLPADAADAAMAVLSGRGLASWVCGSAAPSGSGTRQRVSLFGQHDHA